MKSLTTTAGLVAGVALSTVAAAQTILVHDGAAAQVRELTGPPDPSFCLYPLGPVKSQFPTAGSFACPLPGAVQPRELRGDITVDRVNDTVWVTDGNRIAEYDAAGVPRQSFGIPPGILPNPVLGLGFNGALGTMWATDGNQMVELNPPGATCGTPTVASGPFSIPALGPVQAAVTDIDFDPATNTLWVCDAAGLVGNLTPIGGLLSSFQATPGACGLTTPLLGVTVDTSVNNPGTLFLTDGSNVATIDTSGIGVTTTFGQPFQCFGVVGGPTTGAGFSSRPIHYGAGGGVLAPPEIGAVGEAISPTSTLAVTLSGASPGSLALLPFSLNPLCPQLTVATVPVLIFPSSIALFSQPVSPAGTAQQPIPIPPGAQPGLEVFYQWFVLGGGPSPDGPPLLSTAAGSMRLGFP